MSSLEADLSNYRSVIARIVMNVRQWLGGIALGCGFWCSARLLCAVEAGAAKLHAKTCLKANLNFTVKTTGKAGGRIPQELCRGRGTQLCCNSGASNPCGRMAIKKNWRCHRIVSLVPHSSNCFSLCYVEINHQH